MGTNSEFVHPEDISRVINFLRVEIDLAGSQANAARKMGVSEGLLSEVLKRKKLPSSVMLKYLDLKKVIRYEPNS